MYVNQQTEQSMVLITKIKKKINHLATSQAYTAQMFIQFIINNCQFKIMPSCSWNIFFMKAATDRRQGIVFS